MAAADWSRSTVVYGQQSTIDLVRNQTYNTKPLAGSKQPREEIPPNPIRFSLPQPPTTGLRPSIYVQTPAPPRLQASRVLPTKNVDQAGSSYEPPPVPLPPLLSSTPGPSQNPLLTLRHPLYGLPPRLVDNLDSLGVHAIYPWQSSCLLGKGLLTGEQNLVYTAPTGGGKSLVADILLLKRIINNPGKKGILVLPYVALVQEKLKWLRSLADGVSRDVEELSDAVPYPTWQRPTSLIRVSGFFGGSKSTVNWSDCDVAVCTIEKANSLVNAAIEDGKDSELGVLVLDELHMLNDENRGYLMELLATKLMSLDTPVQIVGMSATLPNPQLLARWLKAKFYIAKYRPIPIEEHLVYDNAIYPTANAKEFFLTATQLTAGNTVSTQRPQPLRTITRSDHRDLQNPMTNAVVALAVETALMGHGALVFCSSRLGAERMASLISDTLPINGLDQQTSDRRQDLLASLRALPGGFEATFSKTVLCGVGFHHAGLTVEERTLVAEAYDTGILRVMVATCSLAAGINLPARRVILNGARMGRDLVGPAMLRQMRGRAGRKGKDEVGETYLCCQKSDLEAVAELLEAEMPPVESCLTPEKRGIKRALLEVIGIRMASSRISLDQYVQSSLLWHTTDHTIVTGMVDESIKELIDSELIQTTEHEHCLEPTRLGMAVVASGLSPEDGIFVHSELCRALESFVMDGDMHIFYLFTPVQTSGMAEISWPTFRNELHSLDESGLRAIRLIGVNPALVDRLGNSGGSLKENTPDEIRLARVYRRAYAAFQLRDLCNEIPVHVISVKYSVPRGHIQTLAQTCHGFAAGMIKFCERMGWGMLAAVLEHMLDRLRAGARADLLEMAQVAFVKSRMARIFWENGFRSARALGEADPQTLVPVMMQAQAKKTRLQGEAAEKFKQKLLAKAEIIVNSASKLWERQQQAQWDEE
ncbi:DNA polymerase theta subunit [Capronia epimyces CBS 606.96]|uniref:DNA polymerase theta subunit n=1 Tax=Capronia epimyces CBS 606.96 TaxID=1182542 RepID=W9YWE6_9EURO|nr:DNA polymerase theta subunit [Capronia epimyces CBS 606.96]EXJ86604.1 DNA polymerase theta subunit [Capronia epimyces CBS 606.96]